MVKVDPQTMPSQLPSSDPGVGDVIGSYKVTGLLGRGGMAMVYAVADDAGRSFALKLLLAHVANEEVLARFQREFRALSELQHPNVTRVHETGTLGDRPYYVMELLSGHDLRREMEIWSEVSLKERFRRAEDVLVQIASALGHIHARGLVHRDISPSNIMVLHNGEVKLMDFGVVKEPGTDLTTVGELVGTVAYIAPEQFTGERVDERADLYSLGAVLYVMLTGRRPFHARTLAGYLEKHMHRTPRAPREIVPSVPAHLDEACLRLLAKAPVDRFASANHLLHFVKAGAPAALDVSGSRWPHRTVGRAGELALLREAVSVLEGGRGGVLLLQGPKGSGKSRLLDDLAQHGRERGLKVFMGLCRKVGGRAFSAYAELYAALETEGESQPGQILQRVFRADNEGAQAAPVERYGVYAAFIELARAQGPAVFVLEDVHNADSGSVALTEYLVRNMLGLSKEPVLFILSRAPVQGDLDPLQGVVSGEATGADVQTLELGPLSQAAVEDLLLSLVPGDRKAGALARRIHQESEGNAHFVVEMIRGFLDEDVIRVNELGMARLRSDIGEITRSGLPLPHSLRHALKERLAPLSPAARKLATVVAVARQEVGLELLCRVTGMESEILEDAADELVESGVARCRRVGREEHLDINLSGLRDVLLDGIDGAERQRLHRVIGGVLERVWRGRLGSVLEVIAWHFERGNVPAKAYPYLIRAGEHLLSRSFVAEALVLFDSALRLESVAREYLLLDEADRALARLLLARSRAFAHLGRWEDADGEAITAHRIATELEDQRLLAQTFFELGSMHRRRTDLDKAEELFGRALELAEQEGDAAQKIAALNRKAGIRWSRGDLEGAKRAWIQVLALGETTQDRRSVAAGYAGLGLMAICRGQSAEARRHLEQACREYERLGALDTLVVVRVNLVELYHLTGNMRRGLELADRAVVQAREIRHEEGVALGLRYRAIILVDIGRLDEARSHVDDALERVRQQGNLEEELGCHMSLARIAFFRQDYRSAEESLDRAEPMLERYDLEGVGPILHAWRAQLCARRGDLEGMRAALERSTEGQERRWPLHTCRVAIIAARTLALAGLEGEAMGQARSALEVSEAAGYRFYCFQARKLMAQLDADSIAARRHQRVAQALARSLAANLVAEDARTFLSFYGFEDEGY